jgi:hypothetical protein
MMMNADADDRIDGDDPFEPRGVGERRAIGFCEGVDRLDTRAQSEASKTSSR